jgi:hypothetical protein
VGLAWNITFLKKIPTVTQCYLRFFNGLAHTEKKNTLPFHPSSSWNELQDLFHFAEPELDSSGRGGNLCSGHENVAKSSGPLKWLG